MKQASVDGIVALLKQKKRVGFLIGAGCSVSSGIPDFRSAGGFYETLKPELLTATSEEIKLMKRDPTYVVSWEIFKNNQFPYHEVRKPFILGLHNKVWKATISHFFIRLCQDKGKLG